jgi:hypothetical protein
MNADRYQLAQPPRDVPFPVRTQAALGDFSTQFGCLFFGFGMIFVWVFGLFSIVSLAHFWFGDLETATGTVADVRATNASENETPVYATQYLYRVEQLEEEFRGESYTTGSRFAVGDTVTVEYVANKPEYSRIQNTRITQMSWWVACLVSIFPLIGLVFVVSGIKNGLKGNRLLKFGKVTEGHLVDKEATGTRINKRTVYKLTFEFRADDGQRYRAMAKSHLPESLEDEALEQILYDPANPQYAILVDNLPGTPDIDEFGGIHTASFGKSIAVLFLPALVIVVHGTIFLFLIRNL